MKDEKAISKAAATWRTKTGAARQARADLIRTIDQAAQRGASEARLASWAGVSRMTIRTWRGK